MVEALIVPHIQCRKEVPMEQNPTLVHSDL